MLGMLVAGTIIATMVIVACMFLAFRADDKLKRRQEVTDSYVGGSITQIMGSENDKEF